jgi:ankyrin repeat protein
MTLSLSHVRLSKPLLGGVLLLFMLAMPFYAFWSNLRSRPLELFDAAQRGDVRSINLAVRHGADVNSLDPTGRSPLMIATKAGRFPAARWLIEHGANVNECAPIYGTPLMQATLSGQEQIVAALLQNGANPNLVNANGHAALWYAVAGDDDALPTIQRLLHSGADPNVKARDGETALGLALINGDLTKARLLLASGASLGRSEMRAAIQHFAGGGNQIVRSSDAQRTLPR